MNIKDFIAGPGLATKQLTGLEYSSSWTIGKQRAYIETLAAGWPVNPIVLLKEEKYGDSATWFVVDGQQRIDALRLNATLVGDKAIGQLYIFILEAKWEQLELIKLRNQFQGTIEEAKVQEESDKIVILPQSLGRTKQLKVKIPEALRTAVWNNCYGPTIGSVMCFVCEKTQITQRQHAVGHIVAEAKGGHTTIDNLKPICTLCNLSMGTMNMLEFKDRYFGETVS